MKKFMVEIMEESSLGCSEQREFEYYQEAVDYRKDQIERFGYTDVLIWQNVTDQGQVLN